MDVVKRSLFDAVLSDVRQSVMTVLSWLRSTAINAPRVIRESTISFASLLIALAVIAVTIGIIMLVFALFYMHPRPMTISKRTEWDEYVDETLVPHLLALRLRVETNAKAVRAFEVRAMQPLLSAADAMSALFPADARQFAAFLKRYFKSHSAYNNTATLFGKRVFQLPENADDRLSDADWRRVQRWRETLSTSVAARVDVWISEKTYASAGGLPAALRSRGIAYDRYMGFARAAASLYGALAELDVIFNAQLSDITMRYDARQKRTWGNQYIFYYFMNEPTQQTSAALKRIWNVDWGKNVAYFGKSIEKSWRDLGKVVGTLPQYLIRTVNQIN